MTYNHGYRSATYINCGTNPSNVTDKNAEKKTKSFVTGLIISTQQKKNPLILKDNAT